MANCLVSGNLTDESGAAAPAVSVAARILQSVVLGSSVVTPIVTSTVTDASGNFSMTFQQSLSVVFTVTYPIIGTEPMRSFCYTGNIPATSTAAFTDVIVIE